jgi:hypothetical protein
MADDHSFPRMMMKDAAYALEALKRDDSPYQRRNCARVIFASIDGLIYYLKQSSLTSAAPLFSPAELSLLQEVSYDVAESGDAYVKQKFLRLEPNLKFALKMFMRGIPGVSVSLDLEGPGWAALRRAIGVRNRLTHPKRINDLTVTDDELRDLEATFDWTQRIILSNLIDAVIGFRKAKGDWREPT